MLMSSEQREQSKDELDTRRLEFRAFREVDALLRLLTKDEHRDKLAPSLFLASLPLFTLPKGQDVSREADLQRAKINQVAKAAGDFRQYRFGLSEPLRYDQREAKLKVITKLGVQAASRMHLPPEPLELTYGVMHPVHNPTPVLEDFHHLIADGKAFIDDASLVDPRKARLVQHRALARLPAPRQKSDDIADFLEGYRE